MTVPEAAGRRIPTAAVVCPRAWRTALRPWLEYRHAQGVRLYLVDPDGSAEQIRERLRRLSRQAPLTHVVLVGDAEPAAERQPEIRERCVPTHLVRAQVNVHWGSEPEIASDNPFADLDRDGLPELAVGRLPVDSAEELGRLVRRIQQYEQQAARGDWQRKVNFVAGVGGFGQLADTVLEMATKKFLTDGIPPTYNTSMTYGSWRSPFCPDPRNFHQATLDRLNEGCLFWVYIGHGQRRHLDHVQVPGGAFRIFDVEDVARLRVAEGAPIAIFLACYTGAFDDPKDCLAEEMLRAESGPIAALSGSRVTMPYAMAVMGNALMDEYFRKRRETLGDVLLHAKRRLAGTLPAPPNAEGDLSAWQQDSVTANRLLLDALARSLSPAADLLDEERLEHVALFNLLGDPLLRVPQPETVRLESDREVLAGGTLRLRGNSPLAGQGTLELVCRRDRFRSRLPARSTFEPTHQALAGYDRVYQEANDRHWTAVAVELPAGQCQLELPVPPEARGPCFVRLTVRGQQQFALGAAEVYVRRPVSEGDSEDTQAATAGD